MTNHPPRPADLQHLRRRTAQACWRWRPSARQRLRSCAGNAIEAAAWAGGQVLLALGLVQWFVVLHECGHDTLFRTRRLEPTIGRVAGLSCADSLRLLDAGPRPSPPLDRLAGPRSDDRGAGAARGPRSNAASSTSAGGSGSRCSRSSIASTTTGSCRGCSGCSAADKDRRRLTATLRAHRGLRAAAVARGACGPVRD